MAGAEACVHSPRRLDPLAVAEPLRKGNKFLKWEEETNSLAAVTLMVDPKGYFLYWTDQNKETECLEITSIRDTRTGRYAKVPREPRFRESVESFTGPQMETQTLTVVSGPDLVNTAFLNFTSFTEGVAQVWVEELFNLATNLLAQSASRRTFLDKVYTRLMIRLNQEEKIPVRSVLRTFPADKRRVEKALAHCGLPSGRNDVINPVDFSPSVFWDFVNQLCQRTDIDSIFAESGAKNKPYLTLDQFTDFVNLRQRDPRLNELLFPPLRPAQVQLMIDKYEPNSNLARKGQISVSGFKLYLHGDENSIVPPEKLDVNEDMSCPLSHYFINSSHNTYLTAGQLKGCSTAEMYRQVLLSGCRCVELDCWKGRTADEEPIITHGFTMTTEILFKEAIEAIAESAFKTSSYPVILSFENHVDSPKQQAKMAEYCRQAFGEALVTEPLEKFPLEPGVPLPSPGELRGRVLVKNKKKLLVRAGDARRRLEGVPSNSPSESSLGELPGATGSELPDIPQSPLAPGSPDGSGRSSDWHKSGSFSRSIEVLEGGSDEDDYTEEELKKVTTDEGTASIEVSATQEMSNLVSYVQPIKFDSFADAKRRNRNFEMSSFVETKGAEQLTKSPVEFVEYNKTHLSRIYPKGTRVDSSNYTPQLFWNAGCQMVALNFQSLDLAMQLNMGMFGYNGRSGYLLKPEFMRRSDKHFDPFTGSTIDGVIANTVSIKVISGQFLVDRRVGTYVEVDMFGLPVDTKRKMYRTRTSRDNNPINPVWNEEPFVFKKVVLPALASLRVAVFEDSGKFIGHRILPVSAMRPGYHHICLRNESNQPLTMPAIFVFIQVKDYVPDAFEDIISGLSNPIRYQSLIEKRARQLQMLYMDELEEKRPTAPADGAGGTWPGAGLAAEPLVTDRRASAGRGDELTAMARPGGKEERRSANGAAPRIGASWRTSSLTPFGTALLQEALGFYPSSPRKENIIGVLRELRPASLEELKQSRALVKLRSKQHKDLQELARRNVKRAAETGKEHAAQLAAHADQQQRRRTFAERKTFYARSLLGGGASAEARATAAVGQKALEVAELRRRQREELRALRLEQRTVERDRSLQYTAQFYERLLAAAQDSQATLLKKLTETSEKEKRELKKQMDTLRLGKVEAACKEVKDKQELERHKEQITNTHIQEGVVKLKALLESQKKRQERIEEKHQQVVAAVKQEEQLCRREVERAFEEWLQCQSEGAESGRQEQMARP
ncbi:1-phosphatidylinositol 4,5-bisphosphate phosphodiesterase beta-1-like isoform X2 [Petromyzon marinus]|uniref:1-phosphatidylinositol 4,5-bisphosphate phosphodiesterase n=1 Tax=Petromyzon marinus TaxID=7757 RepID=A0AAJ7X495_PETMA|nr:1-phosphatidylinositol 4,5-bisphosphate phosphodiesterase beta-1-like isoform X2 [Petromyzon marinus]